MEFIGRRDELGRLREEPGHDQARLIVVYGRRRVGKTALIEEAYNNEVLWKFEGLESGDTKSQLRAFAMQLQKYAGYSASSEQEFPSWESAFDTLAKAIARKHVVIFFDEFQWMAEMKDSLVALFKYYWDNHFGKNKGCRFVICGSVSSFIVKKVLRSKALYGRINVEIDLKPLKFAESSRFFSGLKSDDVLKIHMTIGGIPKYLLEYSPSLSYEQNVDRNFLHQNSYFFQEFERIFISHFSSHQHYRNVLELLAGRSLSLETLADACRIAKGGSFSRVLDDLTMAGFIEKYRPVDKPHNSRIFRYRLLDEYLHFYFAFIRPNIARIQNGQLSFALVNPRQLQQWHGYAFERFCRKHALEIAKCLQFAGIQYSAGSWFVKNGGQKAQIDLVFERADRVLTICEIKHADTLNANAIIDACEKKTAAIKTRHPAYAVQKVLILAKKTKISAALSHHFAKILFTEDFAMG